MAGGIICAPETIETGRLLLWRSVDDRDKPTLVERVREGGPEEFTRWSGLVVPTGYPSAMEREFKDFTFDLTGDSGTTISYTIYLRDEIRMIGYVSIGETVDEAGLAAILGLPVNGEYAEVDWYIFREFRGQGYAEEALRTLIDRYFEGEIFKDPMNTVNAMVGSNSTVDLEVAEDLGFRDLLAARVIESDDDEDDPDDPIGSLRMLSLGERDFDHGRASDSA